MYMSEHKKIGIEVAVGSTQCSVSVCLVFTTELNRNHSPLRICGK